MSEDQYTILRYCPPIPSLTQRFNANFLLKTKRQVRGGVSRWGVSNNLILYFLRPWAEYGDGSGLAVCPAKHPLRRQARRDGFICRPGLVQARVVQTLDSAIYRINHYPADKYQGNHLCYPVFSRLTRPLGVWGSRTLRSCLRAWDSNAILRMLRLWKKKWLYCSLVLSYIVNV